MLGFGFRAHDSEFWFRVWVHGSGLGFRAWVQSLGVGFNFRFEIQGSSLGLRVMLAFRVKVKG